MKSDTPTEQGLISGILLVFTSLGFVAATVFGVWAYSQYQQTKNNYSDQLATDTQSAIDEAVAQAEAEFEEREKNPFRSYSGSDTYGALTFDFPKFWNVYRVSSRKAILDFYAHPREIPGTDESINFAFRAQILDTPYTSVLADFEKLVENGSVTVRAFEPELVPSEAGVYIKGEIIKGKRGAVVLLPQRDKTFQFWTEAEEYLEDFDAVMKTVKYSP